MKEYNLRNLLFHFKSDYYKEGSEKYEEMDTECVKNLYSTVKSDVEYFKSMRTNLTNIVMSVSFYTLLRHNPSEIVELYKRFNESATGVYGLQKSQ